MKTIYICRDNITGIFSGIYDAWKAGHEEDTCGIALFGSIEQQLFCEYEESIETETKAEAVEKLIKNHLGRQAYWDIYHAALSEDPEKGDAILGTMFAARKLKDSKKIMDHLSHKKVEKVFELSRNVGGEAHALKGFLRFKELTNGVLFSEIAPKNQVLTCLAPHFADRLPIENFMIYDKTHEMFIVHEAGKKWVLVQNDHRDIERMNQVSEREKEFTHLWKGFLRSISIQSRENRRCQMNHLPLRYRPNMVEFDGK